MRCGDGPASELAGAEAALRWSERRERRASVSHRLHVVIHYIVHRRASDEDEDGCGLWGVGFAADL